MAENIKEVVRLRQLGSKAIQEELSDSEFQEAFGLMEMLIELGSMYMASVAVNAMSHALHKRTKRLGRRHPSIGPMRSQYRQAIFRYRKAYNKTLMREGGVDG